ncbi:hypothetical protein ACEPPN_009256 [Leptodophora sp. 'Broadleaf-Isolate-01']
MRFMRWELKTHPKNREPQVLQIPVSNQFQWKSRCRTDFLKDREQRTIALRDAVDRGGFQKLVVFSAGMGFLAGAYEANLCNELDNADD